MVKVHGQEESKRKKNKSKDKIEEKKNIEKFSETESNEEVKLEKKNKSENKFSEEELKIKTSIYDTLISSSYIKNSGLPGDIFDSIAEDIAENLITGLKQSGFNIINKVKLEEIQNTLLKLNSNPIDKTKIIKEYLDKQGNYLISVINELFQHSHKFYELDFNQFVPFEKPDLVMKMKDEDDQIVIASNEDNTKGLSTFSLISTITDIIMQKRIAFNVDEETGQILGICFWKNIKSESLNKRLESVIELLEKNNKNKKTSPNSIKAKHHLDKITEDQSEKRELLDELIKITIDSIKIIKETESEG